MGSNERTTPGSSPLPELAAAITSGAVRLAAATASWLRLVAEFDRRGGWHGIGILSCAHWLAWQCGTGSGAAREHVRVARALAGLPLVEAAFAEGRLSYSKVRALTRIAAPDCEAQLVDFALYATASQTERFCREWRRADAANEGRSPREEDELLFQHWYDDEGFVTVKVRMPAEQGAAFLTAVEARAERDARRERAQAKKAAAAHEALRAAGGTVDREVAERCEEDAAVGRVLERTTARRVSALTALVEVGAANDHRRTGDPPRREVVVHVDAAVLADDAAAGRAHLEGGPPLTAAQARRVLCEATVVGMLEDGREPLAVGRRKRRATTAQRRALLRRDGGCARSGCPESRIERLHAHHLRHWLFGGPTDIDNLVLLCDVDHGLVHEHDLVLSRRDGRLVVTTPDGRRLWGSPDAAFAGGVDGGATGTSSGDDAFAGVHPIDAAVGRRRAEPPHDRSDVPPNSPTVPLPRGRRRPGARPATPRSDTRTGTRLRPAGPGGARRMRRAPAPGPTRPAVSASTEAAALDRILFPDGAPPRPAPREAHYERMSMAWAIDVLMGSRDAARRRAAEQEAAG